MKAKERYKLQLVEYLANPDNAFPNREKMALICGIKRNSLYLHFKPEELKEIEKEALEIRRTKYARQLSEVDNAVFKEAIAGDVQAMKLAYQRFEGWSEKQRHEHTGEDDKPTEFKIEYVSADACKCGKTLKK